MYYINDKRSIHYRGYELIVKSLNIPILCLYLYSVH